jgi:hypothetical protein
MDTPLVRLICLICQSQCEFGPEATESNDPLRCCISHISIEIVTGFVPVVLCVWSIVTVNHWYLVHIVP